MPENESIDIYIQLLRHAIFGNTLLEGVSLDDTDYKALCKIAHRQGNEPLLYDQILKHFSPPATIGADMKQVCIMNMLHQQQQMAQLTHVWDALENSGIKPILLKGFGLSTLYAKPHLRQWGDVDLLVGEGQYNKVTGIITSCIDVDWHQPDEEINKRHYNFNTRDGMVFEIHPHTIPFVLPQEQIYNNHLEADAVSRCEYVEANDKIFRILPLDYNLLFVFLHAWEHFISSGVGCKQLSDLALLASKYQGDKNDYLRASLCALGHLQPWQVMGFAIVKIYGMNKEQWPLYNNSQYIAHLGNRMYRQIMTEGVFRPIKEEKSFSNILIRKLYTFVSRLGTMWFIHRFSPRYAWHYLRITMYKGFKRILSFKSLGNHATT